MELDDYDNNNNSFVDKDYNITNLNNTIFI